MEIPAGIGHLRVRAGYPSPRLLPVTAARSLAAEGLLQAPQLALGAAQELR